MIFLALMIVIHFVRCLWVKSFIRVQNHLRGFHGNSSTTAGWARRLSAHVQQWNSLASGNTWLYFTGIMEAWESYLLTYLTPSIRRQEVAAARRSSCTRSQHVTWLSWSSDGAEVIGTDTDRSATYDFLLVIRSNHGPVSYRFRTKRRFFVDIANFSPPPRVLNAPLRDFPLEFCNGGRLQKLVMPIPDCGMSLTICAFVSIQCQRVIDGRTDRRTKICHENIVRCMHGQWHADAQ